ncbi:MAG: hypothetical protein ACRDQ5_15230, partial [Sciscionella sp.]
MAQFEQDQYWADSNPPRTAPGSTPVGNDRYLADSHNPGVSTGAPGLPKDPRYTHRSGPADPNAGLGGQHDYWQDNGDGTYTSPDGTVVRMVSTSDTGETVRGEVRDRLTDQQDTLQAKIDEEGIWQALLNGDLVKAIRLRASNQQAEQQQYQDSMQRQAANLGTGLELRPHPDIPAANYQHVAHPELQRMVPDRASTDMVGQNGLDAIKIGNELTGHQQTMTQAIARSESGWQGAAGNSARDYMAKLTNWVGKTGQGIQLTGTQLSVQSEAGYRARNGMPEPVLFDAAAANRQLNSMSGDPLGYAMQSRAHQAAYQQQLAAQQQAAHVVQTYDNNLGGASTSPAFATPPDFGGGEPRPPITTPPPHDSPREHHGKIEELRREGNDDRGGPIHSGGPRGGGPNAGGPNAGGHSGGGKPEGGPVRGPGVETITDDPVGGGRPIVTNPAGYHPGGPSGSGPDPAGGFRATGSAATRSSTDFGGAAPIAGGFGGQGGFGA